MDYKDTLNLPKTAFPMRGNLPQREPLQIERWEQASLYDQLLEIHGARYVDREDQLEVDLDRVVRLRRGRDCDRPRQKGGEQAGEPQGLEQAHRASIVRDAPRRQAPGKRSERAARARPRTPPGRRRTCSTGDHRSGGGGIRCRPCTCI